MSASGQVKDAHLKNLRDELKHRISHIKVHKTNFVYTSSRANRMEHHITFMNINIFPVEINLNWICFNSIFNIQLFWWFFAWFFVLCQTKTFELEIIGG